jgi:Rps23 Pro-64 3,4-dihydroxylase Tpa1-like proline 4-hydroxylase
MRLAARAGDWSASLAEQRRVHVPNLLDRESAQRLHESLSAQEQWNLVFNRNGEHVDIGADSVSLWDDEQRRQFDDIVFRQASDGFQYLYKAVPIYDIYHGGLLPGHFFNSLFEFLNGPDFLAFARELTGCNAIGFCDAQATCYEAGHFLTTHDDATAGKNRVAAYVINMTPEWNPNWGGALQFFDDEGNIQQGFTPSFNALNVFLIPQRHAVEYVTPFATGSRLSITGWFRTGSDPGS